VKQPRTTKGQRRQAKQGLAMRRRAVVRLAAAVGVPVHMLGPRRGFGVAAAARFLQHNLESIRRQIQAQNTKVTTKDGRSE